MKRIFLSMVVLVSLIVIYCERELNRPEVNSYVWNFSTPEAQV